MVDEHAGGGDDQSARQTLIALLDVLPMGVILLDAQGNVLETNQRAAAMLRADDGLGQEKTSLRAATPAATRALRGIVSRTVTAGSNDTDESDNLLLLPRPSGQHRLEVLVVPIPPNAAHLFTPTCPAAVVFVGDPERRTVLPERTLGKCYDLTPTEARIAIDLSHGETVAEIACRLGVKAETVRWHVKQILAKTGTRRQAELVRLLLISPLALIDML
jgi:DNA-binding CsgD family transcriptional regulator